MVTLKCTIIDAESFPCFELCFKGAFDNSYMVFFGSSFLPFGVNFMIQQSFVKISLSTLPRFCLQSKCRILSVGTVFPFILKKKTFQKNWKCKHSEYNEYLSLCFPQNVNLRLASLIVGYATFNGYCILCGVFRNCLI